MKVGELDYARERWCLVTTKENCRASNGSQRHVQGGRARVSFVGCNSRATELRYVLVVSLAVAAVVWPLLVALQGRICGIGWDACSNLQVLIRTIVSPSDSCAEKKHRVSLFEGCRMPSANNRHRGLLCLCASSTALTDILRPCNPPRKRAHILPDSTQWDIDTGHKAVAPTLKVRIAGGV
eukprot:4240785-Prymnesium_polylepis.1